MIDEPTTTIAVRRWERDDDEDHFDSDTDPDPTVVASNIRANISVPTNQFPQGTERATTYRFFTDPLPDGANIVIGDRVVDERTEAEYSVRSALLRVDADYPDDLLNPHALSHIVGELADIEGTTRG